jgi:large conductance mechanosensitive channel
MFNVASQLKEFKKFILRGNVVDLAVGVAIGAAFNSVVAALVKDFITPLVGTVSGKDAVATGEFVIRNQKFLYGDFINVLVSFVITAAVIFFLVIQPINRLTAIANKGKATVDPTTKKCPECLSEVPKDATRCKFCTSKLELKPAKASK